MTMHPQRTLVGSLMAVGLLIACSNGTPWNGSGDSGVVFTNPGASSGGSGAPSSSSGTASGSGGNDSGTSDTGAGSGGNDGSSGGTVMIMDDGGACTACSADNDCRTACPAVQKLMPGYTWCCVTNYCIMWQGTCPMPSTSGGSSSGGAACGAAMQPCCSTDPACQMGLMCQSDGTCG